MINGIDVFYIVSGLALLFVLVCFYDWKRQDEKRRMERLRQRGLA